MIMKEIINKSLFSFFFKGLGALSFFFLNVYISRVYGLEELGAFNMVLVILVVCSGLGKLGIDLYLVRKLPEYAPEPEKAGSFIEKVIKIVLVYSSFIGAVLGVFLYFFADLLFGNYNKPIVLGLLPFAVVAYALYEIICSIFWGYHKINTYNFFKLFSTQFFTFCLIFFFGYAGWKLESALIYYAVLLISLIVSVVYLISLFKEGRIKLSKTKYHFPVIKKSLPMMVSTMMLMLTLSIDRMMLGYYWDLKTVGIFSAISKITFVMTFFPSIVSSFMMPKVAQAYAEHDFASIRNYYNQSLKTILLSTLPFLIVFILFPRPLLKLFDSSIADPEHIQAFYIFLGAYFVSGSLLGPLDLFLNMTDNQRTGQVTIIIGAVVNLVLNWLLIPEMGISGAGIATFISFCLWQGINLIILKKKEII